MTKNTSHKTSNAIQAMVERLLQNNPEASQFMSLLGGLSGKGAKQKVMQLMKNGNISNNQIQTFMNQASTFGVSSEDLQQIKNIMNQRTNRW